MIPKEPNYTHVVTFKPDFKNDEEYKQWLNSFINEYFKNHEQFLIIETKDKTFIIDKDDVKKLNK